MLPTLRRTLLCLLSALPLAACVAYPPPGPPATVPANFDLSWNAALGAAQDVGIVVSSADRNTGWIYGRRGPANVTIGVLPQPDGSLRVQFDTKGLGPQDQGLDAQFTQAYNRRMGR